MNNDDDNNQGQQMGTSIVAASPRGMAMQQAGAQALVQRTLGEVQVAVMMAKQFPRDKIESKERLMNACCSEGLASLAVYSYARGGTEITGPTIRLAEAAKRAWGNMQSGWRELTRTKGADGVGVSEVEAFAWDTENNTRESTTITVRHWRDTKQGGYALKDERDIRELLGNQAKRIERGCILNSIDGDIIEAALAQVNTTLTTKVQVTPERITALVKTFGETFGITQAQIEKRIQRRVDAINPALIISLTKIYNSLKDGMSVAGDWFEAEEKADNQEEKPKGGNAKLKDKITKKEREEAAKAAGADPATGELPKEADNKAGAATKDAGQAKAAEPAQEDETPSVIDQLTTKFAESCAAAETITALATLKHDNRDFLAEVMQKNPQKYNYCARYYNNQITALKGNESQFMQEAK